MLSETRNTVRRMRIGYHGVGVYHPKTAVNIGGLWRSAAIFGAQMLATVGRRYERQVSDTCNAAKFLPLLNFSTIDDLIDHLPHECPLIGCELSEGATSLHEFRHPVRGFYLFGAEDHGIPATVLDRCHYRTQIPSKQPWSLNLASAGSIVLGHRYMQGLEWEPY